MTKRVISTHAVVLAALAFITSSARAQTGTAQFITVANDVRLEVIDWGGSGGRPVVLLTGLGNNAHVFDTFAPKLATSYHVYGITRRGFGASSAPSPSDPANYSADRLGDDVLAVLDALKLTRPILVGHSLAGEELSSIASRNPDRIAGVVYLDAGYSYAYYDRAGVGNWAVDFPEFARGLEQLQIGKGPADMRPLLHELLDKLSNVEKDLRELQKSADSAPALFDSASAPPPIFQAIMNGVQKYTRIPVPVLAIFAFPHNPPTPGEQDTQIKAFENGVPTARVIVLPNADHYIFRSNESDVLREMRKFIDALP